MGRSSFKLSFLNNSAGPSRTSFVNDVIPPELLMEIFISAWWKPLIPFQSSSNSAQRTAIVLVCKHWKNLVWSTPQLWSRIDVRQKADDLDHVVNHRLRRALAHARMAAGTPIYLFIESNRSPTGILNLLAEVADRVVALDINIMAAVWGSLIKQDPPFCFPQLRSLCVRLISLADSFPRSACLNLSERAPLMTSFAASGILIYSLKMPWSHLTSLLLEEYNIAQQCIVLQHCKNLRHLTIWSSIGTGAAWGEDQPIMLPNLQTFCYEEYTRNRSHLLFNAIVTPRLEVFAGVFFNDSCMGDVVDFFRRSDPPQLKKIIISQEKDILHGDLEDLAIGLWSMYPLVTVVGARWRCSYRSPVYDWHLQSFERSADKDVFFVLPSVR